MTGCPPSPESGDFIANEQRQLSHDLEDALHVMGMHSHKREERGRILSMMYLLETGHLRPALLDQQLQSAELQPLYTIACNLTVNQCFKNDYWILKEFIKLICRIDKDEVRERVRADLAVEEPLLFDRLKDTASLSVIPCDLWLNCCFAGIICQPFLIKYVAPFSYLRILNCRLDSPNQSLGQTCCRQRLQSHVFGGQDFNQVLEG